MHANWFTRSIRGSVELRQRLSPAKSIEQIEKVMAGFRDRYHER